MPRLDLVSVSYQIVPLIIAYVVFYTAINTSILAPIKQTLFFRNISLGQVAVKRLPR